MEKQAVKSREAADFDSDSEDNIPISLSLKRRASKEAVSTSGEIRKSFHRKRLRKVTFKKLVEHGLAEAEKPVESAYPDVSPSTDQLITIDDTLPSPVESKVRHIDCSWEEVQRMDQKLS